MPYAVRLHREADKFLDRLAKAQPKDADAIEDAIERLAEDPKPPGCKPLIGIPEVWRVCVGKYRICYHIRDDVLLVYVITISTRDNVYDALRRRLGR